VCFGLSKSGWEAARVTSVVPTSAGSGVPRSALLSLNTASRQERPVRTGQSSSCDGTGGAGSCGAEGEAGACPASLWVSVSDAFIQPQRLQARSVEGESVAGASGCVSRTTGAEGAGAELNCAGSWHTHMPDGMSCGSSATTTSTDRRMGTPSSRSYRHPTFYGFKPTAESPCARGQFRDAGRRQSCGGLG
jgi:hypothetical protein